MERLERKLATVQEIRNVTEVPNSDFLECVQVLGWKVVVRKNEFKTGDKCIYFEVDSFLPIKPEFEFLANSSYRKHPGLGEGFRLKTMKLRGQISQGLVLKLSDLNLDESLPIGTDLTEQLSIIKWEPIERYGNLGIAIQGLPFGLPKTNEIRVQTIPDIINEFKGLEYYISTKIDGMSITMYLKDGQFGICNHGHQIIDNGASSLWRYAKEHKIEERMKALGYENIAIQGELAGPLIQKNRLKLKKAQWFVFNIIDIRNNLERVDYYMMKEMCEKLHLTMVPIEEIGTSLNGEYPSLEDLLERSKGFYESGLRKEGIVIRPTKPCYSETLNDYLSIKVLNNDFLLKDE